MNTPKHNWLLLKINNKTRYIIFFLLFFLLSNCSFDRVTGIWDDSEEEKQRIQDLEKAQSQIISSEKIYSSTSIFSEEILSNKVINLTQPNENLSWLMSGLNHQNFIGKVYLPGIKKNFLKKKNWKK